MTNDDFAVPALEGETRLRKRQRAFWRYCAIVFAVACVAGIASGYIGEAVADGRLPAWLIYITSALMVIGFLWFFRDYLRRVDELDRMDNLWAGLIGFTF